MIKHSFKAPQGYVYINYEQRLFGEVIYSTDEVEYKQSDFALVSKQELESIIEQWRLNNANTE